MTLCREKGILKRSLDTCGNGWERVLQSYQCRYNQEVLCLRQPREMTRQSCKPERAAMASKTKRKKKKKKKEKGENPKGRFKPQKKRKNVKFKT